jgi:hypothetical protein
MRILQDKTSRPPTIPETVVPVFSLEEDDSKDAVCSLPLKL